MVVLSGCGHAGGSVSMDVGPGVSDARPQAHGLTVLLLLPAHQDAELLATSPVPCAAWRAARHNGNGLNPYCESALIKRSPL